MPIGQIKEWFNRAIPNPTEANVSVQIGVHYEEVGEMADAIGDGYLSTELTDYAESYKSDKSFNPSVVDMVGLLDALCDQIVTAVGVAHTLGMDIEGALAEVNRSNWSKFDVDGKPIFTKQGKIAKGPDYTKPMLARFLAK